ncbi:ABC transporter permease [Candidatus Enterococcus willemsii]|uniref:ABC transporter permease n=1 Tax=Candidatus Enterococcus willemsii TaxID=1857215 RepID=A0ABQ6YVT2_9ENTE|nr:ABC transporter permease [Enterococcus sp. CU12B]KAF1301436.1 hypothetical protein BAU17_05790 [Enterococcus sp. CU12B]
MRNMLSLLLFELKRLVRSRLLWLYGGFSVLVELITIFIYYTYGADTTVILTPNAQSIPIQMLQASLTFSALFVGLYVGDVYIQDRNNGTIKLVLLRSVSRLQYFMTRIIGIFMFSLLMTIISLLAGYLIGVIFFGWGDYFEFYDVVASGAQGVLYTLLGGVAFSFAYFVFGILALLLALFTERVSMLAMIAAGSTLIGQYVLLFPSVKQFTIFQQLLFFHIDWFTQSMSHNLINLAVLVGHLIVASGVGYFLFKKLDLNV